jgi:lysophospholipase L1-like esterase
MLRKPLRACLALLALGALTAAAPAAATPAKVGPSTSIDALGDSITRGYDSQGTGCGSFADCPANSWATGTNATLNSYYVRTKTVNPSVVLAQPVKSSTTGGNDAVTGAKIGELAAQAKNAVKAPNLPDQVLILLGANDVCTSTEASMTSVASFRASYKSGLETLSSGLPDARIDVSSIPNIFNLWSVLHTSTAAQLTWGLAKICQSMLVKPTSEAAADKERRANVQKRNEEFNTVLGEVCAEFIHCQFDKGAAFAIKFATSDVSTLDYFHPTTNGQNKAAETAWNSGPKFADVTTATTAFAPDRQADGIEGWYRNNVSVTLSASDPEFSVAGTEYKLGEATAWTRYTGPIGVSKEGETTITARSVDVNGNIEASKGTTIKLDKTAPTFSLSCPAGPVTLGASASATVSGAVDVPSGLATNPNGETSLSTSTPGDGQTETVQIHDRAGNTATRSCTYDVHYPDPGTPALTAGASPNADGLFTLAWTGSDPGQFPIAYALQHHNAASEEWSNVASGVSALQFALTGLGEPEGTWSYRVQGSDSAHGLTTAWSPDSAPIVVDKSAPNAPSVTADRAVDYAGGGGWYKDTVGVSFTDNGDPTLADGSAGSGVDPTSIPPPQTFNSDGSHTASGTVADLVGNVSPPSSLTVQVDATPPSLEVTCPESVLVSSSTSATVSASDGQSGLASDPSGSVSIDTSKAGPQTVTRTAVDNVGHETTESCTTQVEYPTPGAPTLDAGTTPNPSGVFGLGWSGPDPAVNPNVSYTLGHRAAAGGEWANVAAGVSALSFAFEATGEAEGTWVYRVQSYDATLNKASAWSPDSAPIVVDKSAPNAPSVTADRAVDHAGGGGWYKDTVGVSFTDNGDPTLADGSAGSGVDPTSIPPPQTFSSDGSHTASATARDNAGNEAAPVGLTVQVDASAPSVGISCPATATVGSKAVSATVTAADGQSGLASDPSGTVPISTSGVGPQTVERTAVDNVGHSTTDSCTTQVGFSRVISGSLTNKLVVKGGESVELTSSAKVRAVQVEAGGLLDVEAASAGIIKSSGATGIRICAAAVRSLNINGSSGAVVIGDGASCAASNIASGVTLSGNAGGVTVVGNTLHSRLTVTGNSGGTTVTNNTVAKALTVTGNTGEVIDTPNTVGGKSKVQARMRGAKK